MQEPTELKDILETPAQYADRVYAAAWEEAVEHADNPQEDGTILYRGSLTIIPRSQEDFEKLAGKHSWKFKTTNYGSITTCSPDLYPLVKGAISIQGNFVGSTEHSYNMRHLHAYEVPAEKFEIHSLIVDGVDPKTQEDPDSVSAQIHRLNNSHIVKYENLREVYERMDIGSEEIRTIGAILNKFGFNEAIKRAAESRRGKQ